MCVLVEGDLGNNSAELSFSLGISCEFISLLISLSQTLHRTVEGKAIIFNFHADSHIICGHEGFGGG